MAALVVAAPHAARAQKPGDGTREDALGSFAIGVYLLESGHADRAIEPLDLAWRASNHDPHVGASLARACYAVRDIARADRVAADVLAQDPAQIDMLVLRARVAYGHRDTATAIGFLERAREAPTPSFETERLLASLYLERGETDKAVDAVERCVRIDPTIPEVHTLLGELLQEANRTAEAESAFRDALEIDPGETQALDGLVKLLDSEHRLDEALPVLERYAATPNAPPVARLKLAEVYLSVGRYDDGIRLLEAERVDGPASNEAELLLGRLYFESGKLEQAKQVFDGLYRRTGESSELARILGDLSLRTGDAAGARSYFERAIAAGPQDYRNYLALFFAREDRLNKEGAHVTLSKGEAASLLERAAALAPSGEFDAQFMVGMAMSSVDSLEDARAHLARANELRPGDRGVLFNLASVHEKRGNFDNAERLLVELHGIVPDDAAVCNFYGYVLAEMGKDLDKAESLVKQALAKEPENGYFVDSLGWVYFRRGEYAHAITELERAIRILGDDPVILEHLGDAYAKLSRYPEALAAYRQSSKLQNPSASLREKIESTERRVQ